MQAEFYYRLQISPPLVLVIRLINLVNIFTVFLIIHFNNILPSASKSSKCSVPFRIFFSTLLTFGSSVSIVNRLQAGRLGNRRAIPDRGRRLSLFSQSPDWYLGSPRPTLRLYHGNQALSEALKQQGRVGDHSNPSSTNIQTHSAVLYFLHVFLHGVLN
jgi:hypothetical protein